MTDNELIDGILSGNEKYFKELVDNYQALVLNTCNSFLHDKSNAEDIAQEVFIEVYLSLHKFKKESKLSTWLYRISVNKSLNYIRDNKKRKFVRSIEDLFKIENTSKTQVVDNINQNNNTEDDHEEKLQLLHQVISGLQENQRIAFTLSKFENLSYKQISEIMDLSLLSVEGLIHRAKMNVQKKILSFFKKTN